MASTDTTRLSTCPRRACRLAIWPVALAPARPPCGRTHRPLGPGRVTPGAVVRRPAARREPRAGARGEREQRFKHSFYGLYTLYRCPAPPVAPHTHACPRALAATPCACRPLQTPRCPRTAARQFRARGMQNGQPIAASPSRPHPPPGPLTLAATRRETPSCRGRGGHAPWAGCYAVSGGRSQGWCRACGPAAALLASRCGLAKRGPPSASHAPPMCAACACPTPARTNSASERSRPPG